MKTLSLHPHKGSCVTCGAELSLTPADYHSLTAHNIALEQDRRDLWGRIETLEAENQRVYDSLARVQKAENFIAEVENLRNARRNALWARFKHIQPCRKNVLVRLWQKMAGNG